MPHFLLMPKGKGFHAANEVISTSTENGNIREKLTAKVSGEPIELFMKPKYLMDVIQTTCDGAPEIDMYFSGVINPIAVKQSGNKDYLSIVLPVRV